MAGILGASLTPYLATKLAKAYGIEYVGYYLAAAALLSVAALAMARSSMRDQASEKEIETNRMRFIRAKS